MLAEEAIAMITAGSLIVREVLDWLRENGAQPRLMASDRGVRWGLLSEP